MYKKIRRCVNQSQISTEHGENKKGQFKAVYSICVRHSSFILNELDCVGIEKILRNLLCPKA